MQKQKRIKIKLAKKTWQKLLRCHTKNSSLFQNKPNWMMHEQKEENEDLEKQKCQNLQLLSSNL